MGLLVGKYNFVRKFSSNIKVRITLKSLVVILLGAFLLGLIFIKCNSLELINQDEGIKKENDNTKTVDDGVVL